MRRNLRPGPLPPRRCTIQVLYPELPETHRAWWLAIDQEAVDLCRQDPGFDLDLLVTASLRTMTAIWMAFARGAEVSAGRLTLDGDPAMARSMQDWLGLSPFAGVERQAG